MKIKIRIEQYVPNGLYCNIGQGMCSRVDKLECSDPVCRLFDRLLSTDSCLRTIKCQECAEAVQKTLEKE